MLRELGVERSRVSSGTLISTSDSRSVRSADARPCRFGAETDRRGTAGRVVGVRDGDRPARGRRDLPHAGGLPQIGRAIGLARSAIHPSGNERAGRRRRGRQPAAGDRRAQRIGPERHARQRLDDLIGRRVVQHAILARQHQRAAGCRRRRARRQAFRTARSPRAAPAPALRSPRRSVRAPWSRPPCPTSPSTRSSFSRRGQIAVAWSRRCLIVGNGGLRCRKGEEAALERRR